MISKTFEWYRIVSQTPSSQAVEARSKAATELIATISDQDSNTVLAIAQGVARQFDGSPAETATIEWLLRTLKKQDTAVSEKLSENQLELRCIAAIALGELLLRTLREPNKHAIVAAAGFASAMNIRPLPKQRYLRAMVEELSRLALNVLEDAANACRKRNVPSQLEDKELDISDVAAAKIAVSRLQTQIDELQQNATMDREEISLFWFIATGFSRSKQKAFSDLPVSVAAIHAALDVSRSVLTPAPLNCFEVLAAVIENKRNGEDCKPVPLKNHFAEWSSEEWDAIAGAGSLDAKLASKFPVVFPVTWTANRMREGQSLPNWTEFKKMSQLQGDADLSASKLARQLLWEKITVSLAGEIIA